MSMVSEPSYLGRCRGVSIVSAKLYFSAILQKKSPSLIQVIANQPSNLSLRMWDMVRYVGTGVTMASKPGPCMYVSFLIQIKRCLLSEWAIMHIPQSWHTSNSSICLYRLGSCHSQQHRRLMSARLIWHNACSGGPRRMRQGEQRPC